MTTGFQIPAVSDTAEFPLVPEGLYMFKLKAMEAAGLGRSFDDKPPKERVKWIFEIESVISADEEAEDFVGEEFWAWTTLSMNKRATMYEWAVALLGREIAEGENINASDLLGKRGRATIVHYEKLNGETGHKIDSMLKTVNKKKAGKPAPPPVDADDDEEDFDEFD